MKKLNLIKRLHWLLFLAIIPLSTCNKLELLTEDIEIILDTDILATPVAVQFLNANLESNEAPENIAIEIIGPDADKVFSVLGEKEIPVEGNILNLGVKKTEQVSPENPLRFSIVVEAPGFMEAIKSVVIEDLEEFTFESIPMINLNDPPKGVSVVETTFQVNKNGVVEEVNFNTPETGSKREKVAVRVLKGTKLMDETGNELRGTARAMLAHYDNRQISSLNAFPGGFFLNNANDMEGNDMGEGAFVSAGFLTLEMYVDNKRVRRFSQPLQVDMEVNPDMINPETGENLQPGDTIPVWSLDHHSGEWQMETLSIVEEQNGELIAPIEQEHLSHWNWDWWRYYCRSRISIRTGIPYGQGGKYYIIALFRSYRYGSYYYEWPVTARYSRLYNGENLYLTTFRYQNTNRAYKLRVYDNLYDYYNRNSLTESSFFNLYCGATTVDFSDAIQPNQNAIKVNVEINATCEDAFSIYPTARFYFRESNSPFYWYYPYYAYLYSGKGSTNLLEKGKSYDFYFAYGPIRRYIRGITIPAEDKTLTINEPDYGFKDVLEFKYSDDNTLQLFYRDLELPAQACETYKKYFGG